MSPSIALDAVRTARASADAVRALNAWLPDVKASDDALRRASREVGFAGEMLASGQRTKDDAVDADAARERGNARYRQGAYGEAIDAYTESLRIAPSAAAHANRAMARLKLKDYNGVVEDCDACAALEPDYGSKVYHRRGVAKRELGEYLESVMDFERALRLEPTSGFLKEERKKSQRAFELEAKTRPTQTRYRVRIDDDDEDKGWATRSETVAMECVRADDDMESESEEEVTIRRSRSTADAASAAEQSPAASIDVVNTDLVKAATKIATSKPLAPPRNGAEFEKTYRRAMKLASSSSADARVDVLRLVPVAKIPSMFAGGLDPDILTDVTTTVVRDMLAIDPPCALEWLDALPKLPRFAVSLALAPPPARDVLVRAFDAVVIERDAVARARTAFAL